MPGTLAVLLLLIFLSAPCLTLAVAYDLENPCSGSRVATSPKSPSKSPISISAVKLQIFSSMKICREIVQTIITRHFGSENAEIVQFLLSLKWPMVHHFEPHSAERALTNDQAKVELQQIIRTLMKYVKYVEHQYMYEQYYSEMQMTSSPLLDKYQTLLHHMTSLLCVCRQKMDECDMKMEASVLKEVNSISYRIPVNKTLVVYESLLVINTYLGDFLAHLQLLVFDGQVFQ